MRGPALLLLAAQLLGSPAVAGIGASTQGDSIDERTSAVDHPESLRIDSDTLGISGVQHVGGLSEAGFDSLDIARRRLASILTRREFARSRGESAFEHWERELSRRLAEFFSDHMRWTLLGLDAALVIPLAFLAIVVIALVFTLVRAFRRLSFPANDPDSTAGAARMGSDLWLRRAQEAARRGLFREALHHAYWTAVYRLAERKIVALDPSRTHRETLRRIPANHQVLRPVESLVKRYERVWFGHEPAGSEAWADAQTWLGELGCHPESIEPTASS